MWHVSDLISYRSVTMSLILYNPYLYIYTYHPCIAHRIAHLVTNVFVGNQALSCHHVVIWQYLCEEFHGKGTSKRSSTNLVQLLASCRVNLSSRDRVAEFSRNR